MKKNTNPNQRIDAPTMSQAASTLKEDYITATRKAHSYNQV
jgi:hypothetical protein